MNMNISKKQEGYVVIIVAALLAALTGFLALAVDIGVLYSARTSAQEVADAAALAGAFTFSPYYPNSPQPQTASNHALRVALNNSVLGQPVTAADVNVSVNVANRQVTVDVQSTQNTYFGRALGLQTENIAVEGVAEAAEYSTGTSCAKPWFIPNTVLSSSDPCTACGSNEVVISGGQVTAFAQSKIGQQFSIKPQDPHNAIRPGDFYAIDLPGSSGGSDYRTNIASCINTYVRCGDFYSVKTGNMVGPTKQGVQDLIGNPPTDTWVSIGQYQTPYGLSDTSRNVIVAPIWDTCGMAGFCPNGQFPSGSTVTVQVIGFAAVFLEDVRGSDVIARMISISSCDTSGGGPGGAGGGGTTETGGTVLSVPLRLVRTQ